jgi:arsenate reductase-like glutaredoxin family protein
MIVNTPVNVMTIAILKETAALIKRDIVRNMKQQRLLMGYLSDKVDTYMFSGCDLIDTENISLPSI